MEASHNQWSTLHMQLCMIALGRRPIVTVDWPATELWPRLLEVAMLGIPRDLRGIVMSYWRPCVCFLGKQLMSAHANECVYWGKGECTYCFVERRGGLCSSHCIYHGRLWSDSKNMYVKYDDWCPWSVVRHDP